MENKETLINKTIESRELYYYSEIIGKKALKIIETKGNKYATSIIENKNYYKKDEWDDIKQEIILQLIKDNYIITRNAYKVVNDYINLKSNDGIVRIPKTEIVNGKRVVKKINGKIVYERMFPVEIDKDDKETIETIEKISFLQYNNKLLIDNEKNVDIIEKLNLTERQKEILNIYAKTQNQSETARFLGIAQKNVHKTMNIIKEKYKKIDIQFA